MTRTLQYAGAPRLLDASGDVSLLEVARKHLGIRSAARGCTDGSCGACRLLVDGAVVNACGVPLRQVRDGAVVEAFETLDGEPAAVRATAAFAAERPTRCRLCVGALAVTAVGLARRNREGDAAAIDEALGSATCMCTGRGSLRRALLRR